MAHLTRARAIIEKEFPTVWYSSLRGRLLWIVGRIEAGASNTASLTQMEVALHGEGEFAKLARIIEAAEVDLAEDENSA